MKQTDSPCPEAVLLSQLEIRLILPEERPRWDQEICEHHYLENANLVGEVLRYVVTTAAGRWVALLGWCSPAFRPLLEPLPLRGVVVTADTEQCQRANAQFLVYEKEADYVFLAKGNQPGLETLAQAKLSGAFPPCGPNER